MDNAGKKKILLIDDDEMHLITAELYLKDEYEIYKVKSGEEALDKLKNNEFVPNLVLLDIVMSGMNGWEVFKKIRAIPSLKNLPIAFLTSENDQTEKDRAFKIGAADYITKPYNMTLLKSKVKDILFKKKEARRFA
jgi:DNA-binding response OmpR family regulator